MKTAKQYADELQGIWDAADAEGRELTPGERAQVEQLIETAKSQHRVEKGIRELGLQLGGEHVVWSDGSGVRGGSPGERFTLSKGYKAIKEAGARGQSWTSGLVDCGSFELYKGTMLEGSGAPGSGTGGGLLAVPQVVPGVVDKLFQPLTLESLLLSGQASTNTVRYAVEGTALSGAAGVAEGGTKPESTLAFSVIDEPVKKVATSISISDELLSDAPAVQTFVNGQLSLFVQIEAERQLLRGTQGGNEVQGILTSRGVPVYAGGTAVGNKAVQLFIAMNGVRGSAFVEPEWVVCHPTDYQELRLLRDTAGQFLGGGPFMGPYGNGSNLSASGQLTGAIDSIWNKPTYVTPIVGAGTALIGSRAAGQVWSRGGLNVEASNSHASYFTTDLVAIRAERRLALTLYRPAALCEVRLA
jgi:HK97 family phage major capsid protein